MVDHDRSTPRKALVNLSSTCLAAFAATMFGGSCAQAVEPMTEKGVRATEDQWSAAFVHGDAAVLELLLDPSYVSVSTTGLARTRTEVIALSLEFARKNPNFEAKPLAPSSTIQIVGTTALVRHRSETETSIDLFHYAHGQWHAWYSQHTAIGK